MGASVTTRCPSAIIIPPMSAKTIMGFAISDVVYNECNNNKFNVPNKRSEEKIFSKENTPLTFANRLAYHVGNNEQLFYIQNNFWVSRLTNYNGNFINENVTVDNCAGNTSTNLKFNTQESPTRFYNTYLKRTVSGGDSLSTW